MILKARQFASACLLGALLLSPSAATAQIYTYETPEGEVLITTREHPEYQLLEVIEPDRPSPSSRSSSGQATTKASTQSTAAAPARAATTDSSSMSFSQREGYYDDIIREASEAYDVPFAFVKAIIRIESAFQADAVSHAGAMGLMQLMPRTAASLDVTDAFNPRQNIFGGTRFLRILIDRYDGDINLILAAYNAGDVAVRRYDGIPYPKVRQYVASVYYWYQAYSAKEETQ